MDIDQVHEDLEKGLVQDARGYSVTKLADVTAQYDEELPGGGQFYSQETSTHFVSARALADHKKTKAYKKRCKELKKAPYSHEEADAAAGLMRESEEHRPSRLSTHCPMFSMHPQRNVDLT